MSRMIWRIICVGLFIGGLSLFMYNFIGARTTYEIGLAVAMIINIVGFIYRDFLEEAMFPNEYLDE